MHKRNIVATGVIAVACLLVGTFATAQPTPGFSKTAPIAGTGSNGSPLRITPCAAGYILKTNSGGTAWECVEGTNTPITCGAGAFFTAATAAGVFTCTTAAGDISGVNAGAGQVGGGTSGAVTLDVVAATDQGLVVNADDMGIIGCGSGSNGLLWTWSGAPTVGTWSCTTWPTLADATDGGGTLNTIPKWTPDGDTLGNSLWTDDGTDTKYNTDRFTMNASTGAAVFGPGASTSPDLTLLSDNGAFDRTALALKSSHATIDSVSIRWRDSANANLWTMGNDASSSGGQNFWLFDNVNLIYPLFFDPTGTSSIRFGTTNGRLSYDNTTHNMGFLTNGVSRMVLADTGLTIAGTLTVSPLTIGSIPFIGTAGLISQDNNALYWDNTNKRLGINVAGSPPYVLDARGDLAASMMSLINTNVAGNSSIDYFSNGVSHQGSFGYANASSASATHIRSFLYLYSTGPDLVYANATRNEHQFGLTSGSTFHQMANGSSAAVSAANTGRLRYNTTGQKYQISANGGAYVDLATSSSVTSAVSGTTNTLAKFTSANVVGNSSVTDTGSLVTVTNPLTIVGATTITGPANGMAANILNASAAQTTGVDVIRGRSNGTFNTTSSGLVSSGVLGLADSTRSSGANSLINVGVRGQASGGQENYAMTSEGSFVVATSLGASGVFTETALSVIPSSVGGTVAVYGKVRDGGPVGTIGSCGGGTPTIIGGLFAMQITIDTGGPTACSVTFASTYTTEPTCTATLDGGSEALWFSAKSATGFTIEADSGNGLSTYTANVICIGDL